MTMSDEAKGNGGVLITFRDMYQELQRLVGELRDVNTAMKEHNASMVDHEVRIRGLERWRYSLPVALVVSFGSAIAAVLTAVLK